jgi:ribosomal protein S17E
LLLRHAIAVETCGHDGLAKAVWHFLAEELSVTASGVDLLSDIEHFMEHDPETFGASHDIRFALTNFDIEPGRTRIVAMAKNLRRRMEDIPLERRTRNQALALLQATLLLDSLAGLGRPTAATHARLTKLQTMIDYLPEEAQVARLELFRRGFDFETTQGVSGLKWVRLGGRLVSDEHAHLLMRYVIAIEKSDHAELAKPVWHFLVKAIGLEVSGGGALSVIEHFIEHHPKEFEANHQLKAALTSFDTSACRTRIAAMANSLRRRMDAIPSEHRASNQAQALIQAKLLLGSFTDKFQELFEHNPIDACSVARTLATRRHEGAGVACKVAILIAAKPAIELVAGMRNSHSGTPEAQRLSDLESAVRPLAHYFSRDVAVAVADLFVNRDGLYLEKQLATAEACSEIETQLLQELATLVNRVYKGI